MSLAAGLVSPACSVYPLPPSGPRTCCRYVMERRHGGQGATSRHYVMELRQLLMALRHGATPATSWSYVMEDVAKDGQTLNAGSVGVEPRRLGPMGTKVTA
ncbi:unnamed protein product [Boreogadus saida]